MQQIFVYKYLVVIALVAFFVSAYLLERFGIHYVTGGGSFIVKTHIYSYLIAFGVFLLSIRLGFSKIQMGMGSLGKWWWVSLISILVVIFYATMRYGVSGLYMIDTVMMPILLIPLIYYLDDRQKDRVLNLLAWFLFINSLVALVEFSLHINFIPDNLVFNYHFRSTAFLGHPLVNALITASLAPALMSRTKIPTVVYFCVVLLSLFAFGGRSGAAIFLIGCFLLGASGVGKFIQGGVRINQLKFAVIQMAFLIGIVVIVGALAFSSVGERILSKMYVDTSAQARFDVFILLDNLSFNEWIFGATQSFLENIKFYIGIETIENYAIGWILSFGLVGCLLMFVSSFLIPVVLAIKGDLTSRVVLGSFFLISMTNNALSVKTNALVLLFLVLACRSRKYDFIQIR